MAVVEMVPPEGVVAPARPSSAGEMAWPEQRLSAGSIFEPFGDYSSEGLEDRVGYTAEEYGCSEVERVVAGRAVRRKVRRRTRLGLRGSMVVVVGTLY